MPIIELGRRGYAIRDCPNLILPILANSKTYYPSGGTAWSRGGYSLVATVSASYPFILHDLIVAIGLVAQKGGAGYVGMTGLEEYIIGTGNAGSEVDAAFSLDAGGMSIGVAGCTCGLAVSTGYMNTVRTVPIGPIQFPASTKLSLDAAYSGVLLAPGPSQVYLSGYDATTLDFADVVALDKFMEHGLPPVRPSVLVALGTTAVVSGASSWAWGSWTEVVASLDEDYLLETASVYPTDTTSIRNAQFDIGIGAAGSEAIQARFCNPTFSTTIGLATFNRWPYPFIARKGERVAIRAAAATTASRNYQVGIYGRRLS